MKNAKENILNLLKTSPFGQPVKTIADSLGISRTTALKYLSELEKENLVFDLELGQYHVFVHRDIYMHRENSFDKNNPANSLFFTFYRSLIRSISIDLNKDEVKAIGKRMGTDSEFEIFLRSNFYLKKQFEAPQKIPELSQIAALLMNSIDAFCKLFDYYEWRPPILMEDDGIVVLQLFNSELILKCPNHFYLISGLIESFMNKAIKELAPKLNISAKVDIIQILQQDKTVQIRFEFILS